MKYKNVGYSSSRTPLKHLFLDNIAGKINGILCNPITREKTPCQSKNIYFIDLCAGDARSINGDPSSPEILLKHHNYAKCHGMNSNLLLIEKNKHTFQALKNNIGEQDAIIFLNTDARDFRFPKSKIKTSYNIIINCDPNHINEMPMSTELIKMLKYYDCVTLIITLGCNVGGLKRLSFEERQKWWEYVGDLMNTIPDRLDFLLIELENDSSQWAYLISMPFKWSVEKANELRKISLEKFKRTTNIYSYKRQKEDFFLCCNKLFSTNSERGK